MTADELRAKHHVGQNEAENQCQACYSADGYPCDVIKVLDATELDASIIDKIKTSEGGWLSSSSIDIAWELTDEEANYLGALDGDYDPWEGK